MGQRICGVCGGFNFDKNTNCKHCDFKFQELKKHPNYMGREH